MLTLKVNKQQISVVKTDDYGEMLVANSKGEYECLFEFDDSWDGFAKTAIFVNEDRSLDAKEKKVRRTQDIEKDRCLIPKNILRSDSYLQIGVYGVKGDIERPTVFTPFMLVRIGASPDDNIPEPEPNIYLQLVEEIKKLRQSIPTKVSQLENDAGYITGLMWNK